MRLIIVRHGETVENAKKIMMGHLHGQLTKRGTEQARATADALKGQKINYIYSSDLARAADTAKIIATQFPKVPIEFTSELRERDFGAAMGEHKHNIRWDKPREHYHSLHIIAEGVETMDALHDRAKNFLDRILRKHPNDTVLLVTHNGFALTLIGVINKKSLSEIVDSQKIENAAFSIFEIPPQ